MTGDADPHAIVLDRKNTISQDGHVPNLAKDAEGRSLNSAPNTRRRPRRIGGGPQRGGPQRGVQQSTEDTMVITRRNFGQTIGREGMSELYLGLHELKKLHGQAIEMFQEDLTRGTLIPGVRNVNSRKTIPIVGYVILKQVVGTGTSQSGSMSFPQIV